MNGVDRAAAPQQVLNSVKCECTEYGEPDRIKSKIWDFLFVVIVNGKSIVMLESEATIMYNAQSDSSPISIFANLRICVLPIF